MLSQYGQPEQQEPSDEPADRMATIRKRLDPYLSKKRSTDSRCPDGKGGFACSCPLNEGGSKFKCGGCGGACYLWGGKDTNGVDCSHLVAATDPEYWKHVNDLKAVCRDGSDDCPKKTKCPLLDKADAACTKGTQQQLQLLKMKGDDDIDNPEDLLPGDAIFFKDGSKGPVEHVVQLAADPTCTSEGGIQTCRMHIISAPGTGSPVHETDITLTNGCYCVLRAKNKCLQQQCLAGGGSPP